MDGADEEQRDLSQGWRSRSVWFATALLAGASALPWTRATAQDVQSAGGAPPQLQPGQNRPAAQVGQLPGTQPSPQPVPEMEPTTLRNTPLTASGQSSVKPAYRGRYKPVGKPVKPVRKPLQKPISPPQSLDTLETVTPSSITISKPPGLPPLPDDAVRRRRRITETDPYAPLGFSTGGMIFRPSIEESLGYDTNPNRLATTHKGSTEVRTEGILGIDSDWDRHQFTAKLRGAYLAFPSVRSANRPEGEGTADLRLDVLRDTRVDLGASYLVGTQQPGSTNQPLVGGSRALTTTYGATAGVTQSFGRTSVGLRASVTRNDYEDVTLTDGTTSSQADRALTTYGARLRVGHEITPGWQPFAEANVEQRSFDQAVDRNGFRRSGNGWNARLGSAIELSRLVTGEVSAGYGERRFDDARLAALRGPVADASLIWQATPLTTVTLRGSSGFADTTLANSSGATVRAVGVEVSHALLRNLTIAANAQIARTDYRGANVREDGFTGGVKLEYKLTRSVALKASFTHERLNSSTAGADYTANVYLVGLRLQY